MTIPLGNSVVPLKTSSAKCYLSLVNFFVHWKGIFSLPTFEQFGVNSICKSVSTPWLKSKTITLQYLGQQSSKLSRKPLVRNLISQNFFHRLWFYWYFFIRGLLFEHKQYVFDSLCTDVPPPSEKIGRRDVCESPSLIVFRYTFTYIYIFFLSLTVEKVLTAQRFFFILAKYWS